MTRQLKLGAIALGLAVVVTGCAAPPSADVDAAKASVDRAASSGANRYAAESLKSAEDARAALDAELKVQEGKWLKSVRQDPGARRCCKVRGRKGGGRCGRREAEGGCRRQDASERSRQGADGASAAPDRRQHSTANQGQGRHTGLPGNPRSRRTCWAKSSSKRRSAPMARSATPRWCVRSRCSIGRRSTPSGNGSTCRRS